MKWYHIFGRMVLLLICLFKSCHGVYYLIPGSDRCVEAVEDNRLTWEDARGHCNYIGGQLAKILNSKEQELFDALLVNNQNDFWIQVNDRVDEGVYTLLDNAPIDFSYWMTGQPDDGTLLGRHGDCVRILAWKRWAPVYWLPGAQWDDYPCDKTISYLCEKPANETQCLLMPGLEYTTTDPRTISSSTNSSEMSIATETSTVATSLLNTTLELLTTKITLSLTSTSATARTESSTSTFSSSKTSMSPRVSHKVTKTTSTMPGNDEETDWKSLSNDVRTEQHTVGIQTATSSTFFSSPSGKEKSVEEIDFQEMSTVVALTSTLLTVPLIIVGCILCRYCCVLCAASRRRKHKEEQNVNRTKNNKVTQF